MPNISILSGVLTSKILELNYLKSYTYKINAFGEKNQTDCDNQSGRKNTLLLMLQQK